LRGTLKGEIVMANVIVDEMRCLAETNEAGSDDIYVMTFRGRIPSNGSVATDTEFTVHGGIDYWVNFNSGEKGRRGVVLAAYDPRSLYVVQMIEKDNGRDVSGNVRELYKSGLELAWTAALARTIGHSASDRVAVLVSSITSAIRGLNSLHMEFPKGNDDEIGAPRRLILPAGNPSAVLHFVGDGGHYRTAVRVA
ncbi:hypothetical protein ACFWF3_36130, partial [Nocardia sp. NPDC060220]|uniref:hypothetical protein n=1 Tax=Nocardia sp. NPDC060220 TaxID=3347076 RepID=UPI0036615BD9